MTTFGPTSVAYASDCGTVNVKGADWANGNGVDAHSNGVYQGTGDSCAGSSGVYNLSADPPRWGMGWQCVELAARLYKARGWSNGFPGVNYAAQIYTMAGSLGMNATAQGSIEIGSIAPGDMVVSDQATYGHVSIVSSIDKDHNKVTTVEQNANDSGWAMYDYDATTKKLTRGSYYKVTGVVHDPDNKLDGTAVPPPSANNTVLKVIKKNQSDGVNAVYWAKADSVYESWWRPGGDGVHHSKIVDIPQADIRDIDVQILGGNLHLLYTATAHNVYETWWYPNQGLHTSNPPIIHTDHTIRKVLKTIAPDGVHQLYVMTDVGVDEYWWRPGQPVNGSRIYTLANPVAMKKFFEPDGRQSLYVADQGYAYEVWWRPGVPGITVGQIIRIAQNDIVDLDLLVDPGTNQHHLFVAEAGSGAWEAKWTPGVAGIGYWHITADGGVRAIQSYRSGSAYNLYIATAGGVYEYWWPAGTTEVHAGTIVNGLGNVREFDRATTVDGAQAVYTAFGTNIAETYWWGPGQPLVTNIIE